MTFPTYKEYKNDIIFYHEMHRSLKYCNLQTLYSYFIVANLFWNILYKLYWRCIHLGAGTAIWENSPEWTDLMMLLMLRKWYTKPAYRGLKYKLLLHNYAQLGFLLVSVTSQLYLNNIIVKCAPIAYSTIAIS